VTEPDVQLALIAEAGPTCSRCGKLCNVSGQRYCRACRAAYMREWRKTHEPNEEERLKSISRAYAGVYKRRGKLKPKPCPCGSLDVEMHHPDHAKPLRVKWMCRPCHMALHNGT